MYVHAYHVFLYPWSEEGLRSGARATSGCKIAYWCLLLVLRGSYYAAKTDLNSGSPGIITDMYYLPHPTNGIAFSFVL